VVAASRLRRAQEQAEAARPYAQRMERMLASLATNLLMVMPNAPRLLAGTGKDAVHLLVIATSDRGLAGGFNSSILRDARRLIRELMSGGRQVKLLIIGRKGRDGLRRDQGRFILETRTDVGRPRLTFASAQEIADRLVSLYEQGAFDVATIIYNRFRSAMTQVVTRRQLIPFAPPEHAAPSAAIAGIYEFEPEEAEILGTLLPRNLAVQIYAALTENAASEQGARMTAMDNATRNAGEMIDSLSITYNRSRQAAITKELIEIISGAEAL